MKIRQSFLGLILNIDNVFGFIGGIAFINYILKSNLDIPLISFGGVALVILIALSIYLKYLFDYYLITKDSIEVHSGFLFKKKLTVPFKNISTISYKKSFIYQIINCYKVSIETNDTMSDVNSLILSNSNYNLLNQQIKLSSDEVDQIVDIDDYHEYKLSLTDLIIFSFSTISIIATMSILFIASQYIDEVIDIESFFESNDSIIMLTLIGAFTISLIISIIKNLFMYYNYTVQSYAEYFIISYGLFNKQTYKLEKKYINGIIIRQNMFQMILKIKQINVINAGYGNDNDNKKAAHLFLAIPNKDFNRIMKTMLFEYNDFKIYYHPVVKAFIPSLIFNIIGSSIILVILQQIFNYPIIYNIILISLLITIECIKIVLDHKYDSIAYTNDRLYCAQISSNLIISFNYSRYIIKHQGILRVDYETNPILRIFKVGNISINTLTDISNYASIDFYMYPYHVYEKVCKYITRKVI